MKHFCSRRCLENFLFKDVNPPQGHAALNTMTTDPNIKQPEEQPQQETAAETANEAEATPEAGEGQ